MLFLLLLHLQSTVGVGNAVLKRQCEELIKLAIQCGHDILNDCYLGNTMVFYRAPVHYYLLGRRNEILAHAIVTKQRYARGYIVRKLYHSIVKMNGLCTEAINARNMVLMLSTAESLEALCGRLNKVTSSGVPAFYSDEANVAKALHTAMQVCFVMNNISNLLQL